MYARLLLVIVALLAIAAAPVVGQNSIEYGKLPMVPPKFPSATSALASRVAEQTSAPKGPTVVNVAPNGKEKSSQAQVTEKKSQSVAVAPPAAIFVLSNGDRLESSDYLLTSDSVQLVQNSLHRTIPIKAINVQATVAVNKQRGLDLKIPTSKSQMVLSF